MSDRSDCNIATADALTLLLHKGSPVYLGLRYGWDSSSKTAP